MVHLLLLYIRLHLRPTVHRPTVPSLFGLLPLHFLAPARSDLNPLLEFLRRQINKHGCWPVVFELCMCYGQVKFEFKIVFIVLLLILLGFSHLVVYTYEIVYCPFLTFLSFRRHGLSHSVFMGFMFFFCRDFSNIRL